MCVLTPTPENVWRSARLAPKISVFTQKYLCSHVWHDSFTACGACCVEYMCTMTHLHVWHDTFICVPWLIHMCDTTPSQRTARVASNICVFTCVTCVTWLIQMCDMTHSHVCHASFICVTWHSHICAVTHLNVCHDFFMCVRKKSNALGTYEEKMPSLIYTCAMTHSYE